MSAAILDPAALKALQLNPASPVAGRFGTADYTASVAIPRYLDWVAERYGAEIGASPLPLAFPQFGLVVEFERQVEIAVCDNDRVLDANLRAAVEKFGPIVLRNACLPQRDRHAGQRNIFPSLRFHLDRGDTQDDRYSLFWRDPFDETHRMPRTSSTLIVINAVAYLQARREGESAPHFKSLYQLFENETMPDLIGKVVLEQGWRAPPGTGEICILDNRTVMHASYYADPSERGYPIGVRYMY
jgi:hypothetical protein